MRRIGGMVVSRSLFGFATLLCFRASGAEPEPPPDGFRALSLPADPEAWQIVSSRSEAAPEPLRRLSERTQVPWLAVWDPSLGILETAYPRALLQLSGSSAPSESGRSLAELAGRFLERHREIFGVGPEGLSPLRVYALGDWRLASAVQMHAGLPVRGSAFRVLLDGRGRVRSVTARVARELPPLETVRFQEEEEAIWTKLAQELDGLAEVLAVVPQIVFPGGAASATPAVVFAGLDAEGREFEIVRRLSDGELLLRRETVAHFAESPLRDPCDHSAMITVKLDGYYPPPDDVYSTPGHLSLNPGPFPIPSYHVRLTSMRDCRFDVNYVAQENGTVTVGLESLIGPDPYEVTIEFRDLAFRISRGHPAYLGISFENQGDLVFEKTFNTATSEWESFHLFAYSHLHRCALAMDAVAEDQGIEYRGARGPLLCEVLLHEEFYEHSYLPYSGRIILGSKSGSGARDALGRLEKIPPTIVYHEWGHEFAYQFGRVTAHPYVVEGIADAFAAYVAGTSLLGYAHPEDVPGDTEHLAPVSDPHARDIAAAQEPARSAADARNAIAGAFWELRTVLSGCDRADAGEGARIAWAVLARWIASCRPGDPGRPWPGIIDFHPKLGLDVLEAARGITLDRASTELEAASLSERIIEIFGRRNIYPTPFVRGDANGDGSCDISDAIAVLNYLFTGRQEPLCREAVDSNDDGTIDLSDPIRLLGHLFLGQASLPPPYPDCGPDQDHRNGLGCGKASCSEP